MRTLVIRGGFHFNLISSVKSFSLWIRSWGEQEVGSREQGQETQPERKRGNAEKLGTGIVRTLGWEESEKVATFVLGALSLRVSVFS